jgi:hypothetical protein
MLSVAKHQQNGRKCWKKLRSHAYIPSLNNLWAHRHCWDQLWSFLGDINRKLEHAPHFREVCFHTSLKTTEFVTNSNMAIILHPPYSPGLTHFDFTCFPNWKWNWRADILKQCPISNGNHRQYLTSVCRVFKSSH